MELKKILINNLRTGKYYIYRSRFNMHEITERTIKVVKLTGYDIGHIKTPLNFLEIVGSDGLLVRILNSDRCLTDLESKYGFFEFPPLEDILMNGELSDYYRRTR